MNAITTLHSSPFALLDVTTHDNRRRIAAQAEVKSLDLNEEVCQQAFSDLTNPRARLSAEMAWLPGIPPHKTALLLEELYNNPMTICRESGLPILAKLNLLAAVFEAMDRDDADDLIRLITEYARIFEELTVEEVQRTLNADRAVSGFPPVSASEQIEAELAERKRHYCRAVKAALNRLPSVTLLRVITVTVEQATSGGEHHAPELINELVDSYEIEVQDLLLREAENIDKIIRMIKERVDSGVTITKPYVDRLDTVARNWNKIARPIQLVKKSRGLKHEASSNAAGAIRDLAIMLFNEHDMLAQSRQLIRLIQDVFSVVPEIVDRAGEDVAALADISRQRKEFVLRQEQWEHEITYRAEIGLLFKNILSISPQGISWKTRHFPLASITRVRWGGVTQVVNGIPTGTTYTIAFGDRHSEAVVELKKRLIYDTFIEKLWRAVCVRLLTEMLESLKAGSTLHFGDALLHDDGITLTKHKLFKNDEKIRCTWGQVSVWNADGSFCIGAKTDKKTYVGLSYLHDANTHILEQVVRMAFTKGMRRLSDLIA